MRIPINENIPANENYTPAPEPTESKETPEWLKDVVVEHQPVVDEAADFFTDMDPMDMPATSSMPTPIQDEEPLVEQVAPQEAQPVVADESQLNETIESEQNENVTDDVAEEALQETEPQEEPEPIEETVSKAEYDLLSQRYDRLLADWENYKKRSARELAEAKENANQNLLKAMMPAFDDFARVAFHSQTSDNPEVSEVVAGVEAIHRKLFNALAREGVIEINPAPGEPFDMNKHQAIDRKPADEEHAPDTIVGVFQVGYEMNGKILRPAMVSVTV